MSPTAHARQLLGGPKGGGRGHTAPRGEGGPVAPSWELDCFIVDTRSVPFKEGTRGIEQEAEI